MENKKTIIGIIIVVILIIGLVVTSYLFSKYNTEQLSLLTEETNNILTTDIIEKDINSDIKTEKNYAVVEKTIKEYMLKLKNTYTTIEEIDTQINPNDIFSAKNIEDKNFQEIENILANYKEKAKSAYEEYKELIKEENVSNYIKDKNISSRQEYFTELYNTVMLSDAMKEKYVLIQNKVETERDDLYYKLEQLKKIEQFLQDNEKYWTIKDDKIQFNNINKMTEYYSLLNRIED